MQPSYTVELRQAARDVGLRSRTVEPRSADAAVGRERNRSKGYDVGIGKQVDYPTNFRVVFACI